MRKHQGLIPGLFFIFLCTMPGCSRAIPSAPAPAPGAGDDELIFAGGREVLGRYRLIFDDAASGPRLLPDRRGGLDKEIMDWEDFPFAVEYMGIEHNPLCPTDYLSGDITFSIKVTNQSGIDLYDVWLGVLDGHGADLADPTGWATTGDFDSKKPYIGFALDDPLRLLADGQSDKRVHVWRNPCQHPYVDTDLLLVGTPGSSSIAPAEVTPDPPAIDIPIWDPPQTVNFRARVSDHQGDADVTVNSNDVGIPVGLHLYDDGEHGDGQSGDGLYATGELLVSPLPLGIYDIWIRAISPGDAISVYNRILLRAGYVEPTWGERVSIAYSGPLNQLGYCDLGFDSGGTLHLAWMERLDWGGVYVFICKYRTYANGELSKTIILNFGLPMHGGALPFLSSPQLIVTPDDDVYVFWNQWSPLGDRYIATYSRMLKDGFWHPPKRIDGDVTYSIYSPHAVCTPGGKVFLLAKDYRDGGGYGICATAVQGGSDDWPPTVRIFVSDSGDSFNLEAQDLLQVGQDGFLHLALSQHDGDYDYKIHHIKIDPETMDITGPTRVSDPTAPPGPELYPCLWVDPGGDIGIAWAGQQYPGDEFMSICYDLSHDGGATWGEDIVIFGNEMGGAILPIVKPYGPDMWGVSFNYNHANFFMVTFDGGCTFADFEVTDGVGSGNLPNFIVGEDFETWHTWRSNYLDTDYNIFLNHRYYD